MKRLWRCVQSLIVERQLPETVACIFSTAWSAVKVLGFWIFGKSTNVSLNFVRTAIAPKTM